MSDKESRRFDGDAVEVWAICGNCFDGSGFYFTSDDEYNCDDHFEAQWLSEDGPVTVLRADVLEET